MLLCPLRVYLTVSPLFHFFVMAFIPIYHDAAGSPILAPMVHNQVPGAPQHNQHNQDPEAPLSAAPTVQRGAGGHFDGAGDDLGDVAQVLFN